MVQARYGRHALLRRAICTIALANVHVAYFISANYSFLPILLVQQWAISAIVRVSTCWHDREEGDERGNGFSGAITSYWLHSTHLYLNVTAGS